MLLEYYFFIIPAILSAVIIFFICLFNSKANILFLSLTVYWGTLFAIEIGFTLKAVQVFSIFAFISLLFMALFRDKTIFRFQVSYYFPFLLFIFTVLLSLINSSGVESIRLLINYLWLQLTAFVLAVSIKSENFLKKVINFSFLSCFITVLIGYFEQIGTYTGFYDPFQYFDTNSIFINFYGPILRMSPGTFANEYGEILQTNAIMITTYLILGKNLINSKERLLYSVFLFLLLCALILNLTRISWIAYIIVLILLMFIARIKLNNSTGSSTTWILLFLGIIFMLIVVYIAGLTFINTNLITIIFQRFEEFSSLTSYTAGLRLEAWKYAWEQFLENPLIGIGFGSMVETHNVFLQLLAGTGIIGTIAFYFMLGFIFWIVIKTIKRSKSEFLKITNTGLLLSLVGCFIFDLTNHGIHHFVLWFLIGLILASDLMERKSIKRLTGINKTITML